MENHDQRQEMAQRARAYALQHHSVEALVNNFETLFSSIVSAAPRSGAPALAAHTTGGV
jgi:hypothetical protein